MPKFKPVNRGKVSDVSHRLACNKLGIPEQNEQNCPQWLILPPKNKTPQPERLAFPVNNLSSSKVSTTNDVYLNSKKAASEKTELDSNNHSTQQTLNRRALAAPEQLTLKTNGSTNGKSRISIVDGKLISWAEMPDDILFISTEETK